jgi:hypothetical protein
LEQERQRSEGVAIEFVSENMISVDNRTFSFDHIFGMNSSQEEVYTQVQPLVYSVLDGYNGCIFAYGQTGSGKTYTMEGTKSNRGVIYRALNEIFTLAQRRRHAIEYKICVSLFEIYNEQINDLLNLDVESKSLKMNLDGTISNVTQCEVKTLDDVWALIETGKQRRSVAATKMNGQSSRSHCVTCIEIFGRHLHGINLAFHSKLYLVDLAGSERLKDSQVVGSTRTETIHINKSLTTLGSVINALVKKQQHIPYRDSLLTFLLREALGGDSKTVMIVQVSPTISDKAETICSLRFASRVKHVELGQATKHIESNELSLLKEELIKYKEMVKVRDEKILSLQCENETLRTEVIRLRQQTEELQKKSFDSLSAVNSLKQQTNSSDSETPTQVTNSAITSTRNQNINVQQMFACCEPLDCTFDNDKNSSNQQQQQQQQQQMQSRRSAFFDKSKPRKSKKRVLFPPFSELQTVITCFSFDCDSPEANSLSEQNTNSFIPETALSDTQKRYPSSPYPTKTSTLSTSNSSIVPPLAPLSPHASKKSSSSLAHSVKPSPRTPKRIPLQAIQQQQQQHPLRLKSSESDGISLSTCGSSNTRAASILHQGAKRIQVTRTPSQPQRTLPKSKPVNCSF